MLSAAPTSIFRKDSTPTSYKGGVTCLGKPRCHVAPFVERQLDVRFVALTGLVWVLGFGVWGLGFGVWRLGFSFLGFRV